MSISLILDTGPFIWICWFSSIEITNLPKLNSISVLVFSKFSKFAATAVAQAAVPHAFVKPAPLSQTLTL